MASKSDLRTFVHFVTESDKFPLPPFCKGGAENAPFRKGGRAQRGGISVRHCANLMWFDLGMRELFIRAQLGFHSLGSSTPASGWEEAGALTSRTHRLLLREDEVLFHLRPHLTHVGKVLAEAAVVVAVLPAIGLALEVVVARGALLVAGGLAAVRDDFLHPPLLRLGGGIQGLIAMAASVIDARGDVVALGLKHVGQVELE